MRCQHCLHVLAHLQVINPEQAKQSILQSLQGVKVSLTIIPEAGLNSLPGTRLHVGVRMQGRGKSGLDQQQLEAFDAAVAVLEEDGGLKVQAAGHDVH